MDEEVKLWYDTAFSTDTIWDDVNDEIRGSIKDVLPLSFETGQKWYKTVKWYDDLPWKVKHHLDIRMEMNYDTKLQNK
jgi:hypothetical protein